LALRIRALVLEKLRTHGEQAYAHECCGVLLGRIVDGDREAVRAVLCSNTRQDSPQNRYQIDPRDLIRIQREGRRGGLDIIGFYHSHPDHPPEWSRTDLAEAHWTGCSYVITSVEKGIARSTRSFLLAGSLEDDKHFVAEEIVVVDGEEQPESQLRKEASLG
jgi:proteasome lid subunit RPN8/RPN11